MAVTDASKEQRLSHTIAVRLREKQFKRLQSTLRNFEIQGDSLSEQLRALFRKDYFSSLRWRRMRERFQRERERERGKLY
jgi:hypothetical protein